MVVLHGACDDGRALHQPHVPVPLARVQLDFVARRARRRGGGVAAAVARFLRHCVFLFRGHCDLLQISRIYGVIFVLQFREEGGVG